MEKLSQKYPGRYQKTASDEWRCPPGEVHAAKFGLKYCVRTDAELDEVFTQNLMFLEDYLEFKSNLATLATSQIRELVTDNPGITIAALLSELIGICANDVYILIAMEQLYVDLSDVHIIEHWRTRLWIDQQTYNAYNKVEKVSSNTSIASIYPTKFLPNTVLMWDSQLAIIKRSPIGNF
jgi:putative transposase